MTLTLDNENKIEVETMLVKISAITVVGKNFMAAEAAPLPKGLLDISVYPDCSKAELLSDYAALTDGGYSGEVKTQHYQANKVKVKTSPKLEVMADGVALGKGTVSLEACAENVYASERTYTVLLLPVGLVKVEVDFRITRAIQSIAFQPFAVLMNEISWQFLICELWLLSNVFYTHGSLGSSSAVPLYKYFSLNIKLGRESRVFKKCSPLCLHPDFPLI